MNVKNEYLLFNAKWEVFSPCVSMWEQVIYKWYDTVLILDYYKEEEFYSVSLPIQYSACRFTPTCYSESGQTSLYYNSNCVLSGEAENIFNKDRNFLILFLKREIIQYKFSSKVIKT